MGWCGTPHRLPDWYAPHSPPIAAGVGRPPPKVPRYVAVTATQLPSDSLRLIYVRSEPPHAPTGTSTAILPPPESRPRETQLASPSPPARRSGMFRPRNMVNLAPHPPISPHKISPFPKDGGFYGGSTSSLEGEDPTLTGGDRANRRDVGAFGRTLPFSLHQVDDHPPDPSPDAFSFTAISPFRSSPPGGELGRPQPRSAFRPIGDIRVIFA